MMNELQAGMIMKLKVDREVDFGYFLMDGEEDVLLHKSEVTDEIQIGDEVEVFLYQDKKGRLTATMTIPSIKIGAYDWAEVVNTEDHLGVFVDIGIAKDMLVSMDELPVFEELWPRVGDKLLVTLKLDRNGRLFAHLATEGIIQQIAQPAPEDFRNQDIQARVYRILKVGTFLISEEGYRCFVHESERGEEPRLGEMVQARIIDVKDDGTLNASLLPRKQDKISIDADVLYEYMASRHGAMPYWDKSYPEDIEAQFGMSKGAFKRALGKLMKENKVYQEEGWTYWKEK